MIRDWDRMRPHHHPLVDPVWLPAQNAGHMCLDDPVLGLLVAEIPYAIPWWVMKNHHQANLRLGGQAVLVNLCEACTSAAAFNATLGDRQLTFRHVDGCYAGSYVITDLETGTVWAPFTGDALYGPLQGSRLQRLPLFQSTWADWIELYPTSLVPDGSGESRDGHGSHCRPGSNRC
jgi:hypothetical protein